MESPGPTAAKRARGRPPKKGRQGSGSTSLLDDSQSAESSSNSMSESPTKGKPASATKSPKGQRNNRRSPRISGASDSDSNSVPMRVTRRSSRSLSQTSKSIPEEEEEVVEEKETAPEEPVVPSIATVEDCENIAASVSNLTSTRRLLGVSLEKVPISWNHRVNLIGEKVMNPRVHICELCQQPILIYGRNVSHYINPSVPSL